MRTWTAWKRARREKREANTAMPAAIDLDAGGDGGKDKNLTSLSFSLTHHNKRACFIHGHSH